MLGNAAEVLPFMTPGGTSQTLRYVGVRQLLLKRQVGLGWPPGVLAAGPRCAPARAWRLRVSILTWKSIPRDLQLPSSSEKPEIVKRKQMTCILSFPDPDLRGLTRSWLSQFWGLTFGGAGFERELDAHRRGDLGQPSSSQSLDLIRVTLVYSVGCALQSWEPGSPFPVTTLRTWPWVAQRCRLWERPPRNSAGCDPFRCSTLTVWVTPRVTLNRPAAGARGAVFSEASDVVGGEPYSCFSVGKNTRLCYGPRD